MSYKQINQKGFAALEAILIIVIVAIIAGTGYYVYHANSKSTDTQNAAQQAAQSAAVNKPASSKTAVAAGVQAKLAYTDLLRAFTKNGAAHKNWDATYVDSPAAAGQFTKTFKTAVDNGTAWGASGAFCTDNNTFESFTVGKTTLTGDTASVTLKQTAKDKSATYSMNIKLDLQYTDSKWAINDQQCVGA